MVAKAIIKITGDANDFFKEVDQIKKETESLNGFLNSVGTKGAVAFAGFTAGIAGAVNEAAKFEVIEAQFQTLTGSIQIARDTLKDLQDFSATTPFQFADVADAGRQLISFGTAVDDVRPRLQVLGDVASASGAPLKDLTLIFGQVQAAGKLTGERLLQLQERAIPIGPALAKTLGVAESAVRDLVSQGKVDFATFEAAFESLNQKGGFAFQGINKQGQTLRGLISTLGDNFSLLANAVGQNFLPAAKQATQGLISFLQKVRENEEAVKTIARLLAAGAGMAGFVTALAAGGIAISKVVVGLKLLAGGLRVGRVAAAAFTGALTLGLGTVVAFLPEIIAFTKEVVAGFNAAKNEIINTFGNLADSLLNIGSRIGDFLKSLFTFNFSEIKSSAEAVKEAVSQAIDQTFSDVKKVKQKVEIQQEQSQQKESSDLAAQEAALQQQADAQRKNAALKAAIKQEETKALQAEQARQNQILIQQAQVKKEIIAAEKRGETEEVIKIKQDELNLLRQLENAKTEEDQELAAIRLENFRIAAEERRQEAIAQKVLEREEEMALKEEFALLDEQDQALVKQKELETLNATQLERRQILINNAKQNAALKKNQRAKQIKDEANFGKAVAVIQGALNNAQVQGTKQATGTLVQLQESRSSKLKSIGKAAAVTQILISGAEAAMNVFNGFSTIPIVGSILGAAGAAATIAFSVSKANDVRKAQKGGVVPGTGSGDIVPTFLEPGEIVVPKPLAPTFEQQFGNLEPDPEASPRRTTEVNFGTVIGTQEFTEQMIIPAIKEAREFDNADIGE